MARLFGANGRPLAARLQDPTGRQARLERNKTLVERWLKNVVGPGDIEAGRGDHNWCRPPRKCLTQDLVDAMRSRGIALYVTPGQFIAADLTGERPRVRQRRPLAERYLELLDPKEEGYA